MEAALSQSEVEDMDQEIAVDFGNRFVEADWDITEAALSQTEVEDMDQETVTDFQEPPSGIGLGYHGSGTQPEARLKLKTWIRK